MFSDILKIKPKLDPKDLQTMQRSLQSRFTKIAKGFGKGLAGAVKGGGIAGIGLALIDKVLNPLKEIQEAIDRTLTSSDDIATYANQFNTTSGKLFKLIKLAESTGLGQDNLFQLINKYQGAIAEAKLDPNSPYAPTVQNYINDNDMADSFFEFIQNLKTMEKSQQLLIQQAVFGEKQVLKMADFLQTDFKKKLKEVGLDKVSTEKLTKSVDNLASLNDLADALKARRSTQDILQKGGSINESMIRARDKSERIALERENARIRSYHDLQTLSNTGERIATMVEEGVALLGKLINQVSPQVDRIVNYLQNFSKASIFRGIFKGWGGK